MKDYMKIYREWLSNPYFDEDTKAELKAQWYYKRTGFFREQF